jgi:peptidylprolyl isomerase
MNNNHIAIILLGILIVCGTAFSGCVNSGTTNNTIVSPGNVTAAPATTITTHVAGQITAQTGDKVTVVYTGTLDDGTVFDTNVNTTPVTFTLGNSSVIDGFQEAVTGMAVNEEKTVTIPSTKAYGPHLDSLVHVIPLMGPLENKSFTVGTYVTITNKTDNSYSVVKILNVTPYSVTWDANDQLAGENLTFTIKVTNIERK